MSYILYKEFPVKSQTGYDVRFLQCNEFKLVENLIPGLDFWAMARAIFAGERCYALWIGTEIVAFVWIGHKSAKYKHSIFSLKSHEGYLYNQFTLKKFRGKGYAGILRGSVYELAKKEYYYSYCDTKDKIARKMKDKLGARKIKLIIELFGKPLTIWNYGM